MTAATAARSTLPTRVIVRVEPDGLPHTIATLRTMGQLATAGAQSYPVRALAVRVTAAVPSKDRRGELAALYRWVRDHIRYRRDPIGLEWVQSPERTLTERAGDCDDLATLLAALAGSLGHPFRFRTVGRSATVQTHVAAEVFDGRHWVTLDPVLEPPQPTTKPRTELGAFGRSAPGVSRIWNAAGEPYMDFAGPVSSKMRELWLWQPYFAPPVAGQYVTPGWVAPGWGYRSQGAPGYPGLSGEPPYSEAQRRWAWAAESRGELPAGTAMEWSRRGVMAGTEPVVLYLPPGSVDESQTDHMGGVPYQLGSIWGFIKKIGKKVGHAARGAVRAVGKIAKQVVKSPIGKAVFPVAALNIDPRLKSLRNAVLSKLPVPQAQMLLKAGTAAEHAASDFARGRKVHIPLDLVAKHAPHMLSQLHLPHGLTHAVSRATHAVHPPALTHAISTATHTVHAPSVAQAMARARAAALHAAKQRAAHVAKRRAAHVVHARPPVHVLPPQTHTTPSKPADWKQPHAALANKYPHGSTQRYDAVAGVFRVYAPPHPGAMSGLRPSLQFTLGAAEADDVKASVATMKPLAQKAADAVAKFIRSRADHRPPGRSVPEVLTFQRADATRVGGGTPLKPDGLWGTNTRAAVAYYTGTSEAKLPPILPALAIAKTWSPPTAVSPVSHAPTTTPKPAKAVVVATPKPALSQIGTETLNPGLPPVGAPTATPVPTVVPAPHPAAPPLAVNHPTAPTALPAPHPAAPIAVSHPAAPVPTALPALPVTAPLPPIPKGGSVLDLAPPIPAQATAPVAPVVHPAMATPALPLAPLPAGPGMPSGTVMPVEAATSAKRNDWLLWLGLLYCTTRKHA